LVIVSDYSPIVISCGGIVVSDRLFIVCVNSPVVFVNFPLVLAIYTINHLFLLLIGFALRLT